MSHHSNAWFVNFSGIGNGIIIAPILKCFEVSYPFVAYYHTENQVLADPWFVEKAQLKNLKGFSPKVWRRFGKEKWEEIDSFIKEKNIDLIVNLRNEGPKYDTEYYQFKERIMSKKTRVDFWDLDFEIIEHRTKHQNLTGDIIALLETKGVNISGYNSKWLALSNYKNKCTGVGFGMAASQSNKRWTTAKWTALTHQVIKDLNQRVVLFSGKSEDELKEASHILHNIGREKCELMNILFLKDVALHMGEICCFVSNDTGLLHMASAMNIPTIGLYISTDSDIWSPHDKINFIAVQNNLTKKCPNPKPHCGNCFHYYDVCPAIIKYGDNIEPSRIFDEIKRIIF
ncbi:MAG: Heptosyltransferase family protein [Parcubacteria group bacterium GW2011_GWA2_47_12]|nr:MAG: Heptosyltransferase family protein [Parcubacteria group bacterium GW2011_GWA2_47_12]